MARNGPPIRIALRDRRPGSLPGRRSGFSLTELMVALALLSVAMLGIATSLVVNMRSYDSAREVSELNHALREMVERIRAAPFAEIASTYQNHTFTIDEISATGTVTIFLNETASSADAADLGLPRDLDGDGAATNTNVASNYILLPILIQVDWESPHGSRTERLYLLLAQETN